MPVYNLFYLHPIQNQPDPKVLWMKGPLLPVQVDIPRELAGVFAAKNEPIPHSLTGYALLDIGASISAVDRNIISQLGVQPIGQTTVFTPSGQEVQDVFPASISFPGTPLPVIELAAMVGSQLQQQGIIVLLGRDFLQHFLLVYNGRIGQIILSY